TGTTTSGDPQATAAGQRVFAANRCANCHTMGGGQRKRGPDLGRVGADPNHTVDWLSAYIRNPRAQKPNSRMPPYQGKIQEQDLRALAESLASLKCPAGRLKPRGRGRGAPPPLQPMQVSLGVSAAAPRSESRPWDRAG